MSASIFREYDIRGIFKKELNENIVKKIGFHFAKALLKKVPNALLNSGLQNSSFGNTK